VLGKPLWIGEQPRRGERQQRPQLHQVVLHRGTGDRELERHLEVTGAAVRLAAVVLDELRLVEDEPRPRDFVVRVGVQAKQRVRRDDDVGGRDLVDRAARLGERVEHDIDAQLGCEPGCLRCPVRRDAGRSDDEERSRRRTVLTHVADEGERLERLPEPHVVGEDSAELHVPQGRQPCKALRLVRPQAGAEPGRLGVDRQRIELEQRRDGSLPALGLLGHDADLGQL
jgi:hypothetical protein